jgi:dUTP pyrophosphatase
MDHKELMSQMNIQQKQDTGITFERVRDDVRTPSYGTNGSAGIDFYPPFSWFQEDMDRTEIPAHSDIMIPSGFKCKLPLGTALIAFNKSGIAAKKGLIIGACVIDEDYEGEFKIHLINTGNIPVTINLNQKIAQFLVLKYERPQITVGKITHRHVYDHVNEARGSGGFGSTDK